MATKTTTGSGRNVAAELAYLTRTLKAPSLAAAVDRLAERARAESWTHEEFLAACLQREVAARESHGGEARIRAARFPARKALEDFDYDHQRSLKRDTIAHLRTLDFVAGKENAGVLRPLRTGLADRHQQQTIRPLGRGLRRRRRSRRHDRPAHPPRRSHLVEGRQLPTQRPRPGPHTRGHQRLTRSRTQGGGSVFNRR